MPPTPQSQALRALRVQVDEVPGLSQPRRRELLAALAQLELDLVQRPPPERGTVYVMEGATGVERASGRASTDPDENMASKAIAVLAKLRHCAATVAVPDEANCRHTTAFLRQLGATTTPLTPEHPPQPGCVSVVSLGDAAALRSLVERGPAPDVVVLGPPLGEARCLLRQDTRVRIMGSAREGAGALDPKSLSTNTQGPEAAAFVLQALRQGAETFSSRAMGPALSLSLAELALGTALVTRADRRHWARNTQQQFLGTAPHHLLAKRLEHSGALHLFASGPGDGGGGLAPSPHGHGLSFLPFLQSASTAQLNPAALAPACSKLGTGYGYLLQQGGAATARQNLRELVEAHRNAPEAGPLHDTQPCLDTIAQLGDAHVRHAFAALALCCHSLYAEKTTDGWHASQRPGQQWRADAFVEAYLERPGRQVPYDALVVLQPLLGLGTTDQAKALTADKVQLVLWAELAA